MNLDTNTSELEAQALMKQVDAESQKLGIVERRKFIKNALTLFGGMGVAAAVPGAMAASSNLPPNVPSWSRSLGKPVLTNPYGKPSPFEKNVKRRTVEWLTPDNIASVTFTPLQDLKGIITPNGLVFERYHGGMQTINPDDYRLMIHGLVERPIILTLDDLKRFPSVSEIKFLECPANGGMEWRGPQMTGIQYTHGMLSCCEWTGVRLSTILAEVGVKSKGKWILAEGSDGASLARSIPMKKALDDSIIVYAQNGEALRPEQGYPVRLINPGWEGNTSVKWLRRLEVGDQPWYLREETSKYTDLLPSGKAREFSFVQEGNSVITSPCPEKPWQTHGWYELEGLAWSGRGLIKHVDVSLDGGVSWRKANLKGLVLPKALTRFSLMVKWEGQPLLLQSRSIDETGYVQPSISQLRKARGVNSIYHNNSIHSWELKEDGSVHNVQVS